MALSPSEEALVRDLIAQNAALLSLASSEPTILSKLGATKATLSDLPVASSLADTDLFLVRQGTTDKSVQRSVVAGGFAALNGSASQTFSVATATNAAHAVRYDQSFGVGQTWQNVGAIRESGTTFHNTTGRPIEVMVTMASTGVAGGDIYVNGTVVATMSTPTSSSLSINTSFVVPAGGNYRFAIPGIAFNKWFELR